MPVIYRNFVTVTRSPSLSLTCTNMCLQSRISRGLIDEAPLKAHSVVTVCRCGALPEARRCVALPHRQTARRCERIIVPAPQSEASLSDARRRAYVSSRDLRDASATFATTAGSRRKYLSPPVSLSFFTPFSSFLLPRRTRKCLPTSPFAKMRANGMGQLVK